MKTIKISIELHTAAKLAALQRGEKLSDFVESAIKYKLDSCIHDVHFSRVCIDCRQIKK